MKNVLKNFSILVLSLSFVSCDKNDDITVLLQTSGKLTAKYVDNNGTALSNINVKLYESYSNDYNRVKGQGPMELELADIKTDAEGLVDFGDLIEGSYVLVTYMVNIDGNNYCANKPVQVVSGNNKDVLVNPQDYVGTVNLQFSNIAEGVELKVLIVDYDHEYNYNPSDDGNDLNNLISASEFSGTVDTNGKISFTLPSGREFRIITFEDADSNVYQSWNSVYLDKDEVENMNFNN